MNAEQKQQAQQAIEGWQSVRNDDPMKPAGDVLAALLQELVDAPEPEPVAWMVKNGFVCSMIYQSKKDADNYAAGQQKRHDLSGSLASFCVIPLYTAPPAPSVHVPPMENIALNEWLNKTEWVQKEINTFPVSSLGMHRADVMRLEIERLRKLLAAAPPAPSVPDGWKHDCAGIMQNDVELWLDSCPHCGKPKTDAAPTPAEAPADVARDAELLRKLKHSIGQAMIPGNDWRRELALMNGAIDAAIAAEKKVTSKGSEDTHANR